MQTKRAPHLVAFCRQFDPWGGPQLLFDVAVVILKQDTKLVGHHLLVILSDGMYDLLISLVRQRVCFWNLPASSLYHVMWSHRIFQHVRGQISTIAIAGLRLPTVSRHMLLSWSQSVVSLSIDILHNNDFTKEHLPIMGIYSITILAHGPRRQATRLSASPDP